MRTLNKRRLVLLKMAAFVIPLGFDTLAVALALGLHGSCTQIRQYPTNQCMNANHMNAVYTPLLLLLAACLEVGGDAIVRLGLKNYSGWPQLALIATGGVVLLGYGIFVNIAPADFGRLLGIYVVLFFVVAQLTNLFVFGIRPGVPILTGGALIVAGGLIITLWSR